MSLFFLWFYFNPRSPWGERLLLLLCFLVKLVFQSTLPVGGATKAITSDGSINSISIHAPRGGSDEQVRTKHQNHDEFQSTLPVGGATM